MGRHEIVLFLELVSQAHRAGLLSYRRKREKNRETLVELGWLPSEMFEFVSSLKPESALCTPRRNQHPAFPEELVCEFGSQVDDKDIYVKVSVAVRDDVAAGCVISFHFAEEPFVFVIR